LRVLEVHINGIRSITIHVTESKIHFSYSQNHDSTLMLVSYYIYMLPVPTPVHCLGLDFFRSPFDVTKLQIIFLMSHRLVAFHSQCEWTRILLSLNTPMAIRTQLGFKRHRESRYSSLCSRKLWVRHYYQ
jgi:hypothetical protein